jgi:hypothetical protein
MSPPAVLVITAVLLLLQEGQSLAYNSSHNNLPWLCLPQQINAPRRPVNGDRRKKFREDWLQPGDWSWALTQSRRVTETGSGNKNILTSSNAISPNWVLELFNNLQSKMFSWAAHIVSFSTDAHTIRVIICVQASHWIKKKKKQVKLVILSG